MNKNRKKYLLRMFEVGDIKPMEWVVAICQGRLFRINGNHSSNIIFNDGEPQIFTGTKVFLYTYDLGDDMSLLTALWSVFDNKESSRSYIELLEVNTGDVAEFEDFRRDEIKKIAAAISFKAFRVSTSKKTSDKIAMLRDYKDKQELKRIIEVVRESEANCLNFTPVMTAMLFTNEINLDKSKDFWDLVAKPTGTQTETSPTVRLRNFLSTVVSQSTMDHEEICAHCLNVWQAWSAGCESMGNITMKHLSGERKKKSSFLKKFRKYLDDNLGREVEIVE